jgi:DNA-directed RNA polymerase specialized sigma24 family protein
VTRRKILTVSAADRQSVEIALRALGLSYREIATRCNISHSAVWQDVHAAQSTGAPDDNLPY